MMLAPQIKAGHLGFALLAMYAPTISCTMYLAIESLQISYCTMALDEKQS
jgi:hypothetical protein